MFEHWKLKDFAPGEGAKQGAYSQQFEMDDWIDVAVPGDVHQALIAAGRIQDPFYDCNELECGWIEEREWWYRLQFAPLQEALQPDERLQLVFQGLDTFVTLWFNGEMLGRHENMFREAVFDVSQCLYTDRPNTLALCFDPPRDRFREMPFKNWGEDVERVVMRKAQFGYGWDWGPRLPTIGIWRPVELRRQRGAALQGVHFSTLAIDQEQDRALVSVKIEIERFAAFGPLEVSVALVLSDPSPIEKNITSQTVMFDENEAQHSTVYLQVEKPELWWTHDLGNPRLYSLQIMLRKDGIELERRQMSVGIRTLELDQSPDTAEPGTRFFRFVLNGIPLFARGANWIPAHSFVGSIPAQRYEMLLHAAQQANMTMLRVWGGGIYEQEVFYELCDQLGIAIWQDFMFACAMYPEQYPTFVDEVEAEARYQVKRLRNHPCLALWCGNNENQWLHDRKHSNRLDNVVSGSLYYNNILPRVVQECDSKTPYWPGSPYGGNDYNSADDGDTHNWQVWHGNLQRRFGEEAVTDHSPKGVSFLHYAEDRGRFISEFGMHASPVYETLRRSVPADQLYHHSLSMDHHNKDTPKDKGDNLMLTVTGLPKDLQEYIAYSMISQAEGLKFAIEHYRRRKPHCSGTLIWQFNDCWPVLSWSLVDYYGFGKAGYFYTQRAYAPVLASFQAREDGTIELWITNDTLKEKMDTVIVRLGTFAETAVWEESHQVQVPANSSQVVWQWQKEQVMPAPDRYLSVRSAHTLFPSNRHFFSAVKDLSRPRVEPEITIAVHNEHELHVDLRAPAYVYFLHLIAPDEQTCFSDNYFDLEPAESKTVVVTNQVVGLTPEMISLGWC